MKKWILVLSLVASLTAVAKSVPYPPANCFQVQSYCSDWSVERDHKGDEVIRVFIFAKFSKKQYKSAQELADLYYDFAKWPDYAAGSEHVSFQRSEPIFTRLGDREVRRHRVRYTTKAPWPIRKIEVDEFTQYDDVSGQYPQTLMSVTFDGVKGFEPQGLRQKSGELHILERGQEFLVAFRTDVIPGIRIFLKKAGPYIHAPTLDIFKGMFNL